MFVKKISQQTSSQGLINNMETKFTYEVMGTVWKITVYQHIEDATKALLEKDFGDRLNGFDKLYSRFKVTSLVTLISEKIGEVEVPTDLVNVLSIYKEFYEVSGRKFTPCIGGLLEDVGYDKEYSLKEKDSFRAVPHFDNVTIIDDTHIRLQEKVLLDIGAVGKGYFVDVISQHLRSLGYLHFLVDGSGDVFYETTGEILRMGLEDPRDTTKVIGVIDMKRGSMCASATNRRSWGNRTHYIDPSDTSSPREIVATWVIADSAAYADALTSLFFFVAPEEVVRAFPQLSFSYCIMNHEGKIKKSQDFAATFF